MERLLSVQNLTVEYPYFTLKAISFDLHPGEIVGLIGENGAGKSTTIKAVMGMIDRTQGDIFYNGELIKEKAIPEFRQNIGYVGDAELYYSKIKVKHILKFLSELYYDWDNQRMNDYLELFHIDREKNIIELSMGMRVKLEILMALSHNAEVYLLDEPTSGLDPVVRNEVLEILVKLRSEGKAILFSSHITGDLEKIADRAIYMTEGEIKLDEKMETLKSTYESVEGVLFALNKTVTD